LPDQQGSAPNYSKGRDLFIIPELLSSLITAEQFHSSNNFELATHNYFGHLDSVQIYIAATNPAAFSWDSVEDCSSLFSCKDFATATE
jgi:hypothetical protein